MTPSRFLAALCATASLAGAQTTITDNVSAVIGFVHLPGNGGIVVPMPANDSEHNIVTSVGNLLFPAGNVRIANDGVVIAGITAGDVAPTNVAIPAVGFPAGIPAGAAAIAAWWQNLCPTTGTGSPPGSISWKEQAGVLYIEWFDEHNLCGGGGTITFEIQVFGNPAPGAPWIQIIYEDPVFHEGLPLPPPLTIPPDPCNSGACATKGYVAGPSFGTNAQWSHNAPSGSTVLSIFPPTMGLVASSPLGPGSLKLDVMFGPPNGAYFLAVTLAPGAYPNGWLFGLDISYADLAAEIAAGSPFLGPLSATGSFSFGPLPGVPPLTLYAIAFGFVAGSGVPLMHTPPISYAIP